MSLTEDITALIDSAVAGRVLVFGSLPPGGRDVDLLVPPPEIEPIREALAAAGFIEGSGTWVGFGACSALAVEVVPAAAWDLPDSELEALFAEAVPLAGFSHLVRPAPHHRLLILARKVAQGAPLTAKRRHRVDEIVRTDPRAWQEAHQRAAAWGLQEALGGLERLLHRHDDPRSARADGRSIRRSLRARRPHRPRVVALSGIDGAGKSSQALALKEALEHLGYEAEVVWTPIAQNAWVDRLAAVIRWVLVRFPSLRPKEGLRDPGYERETVAGPGSMLRRRSDLATEVWATVLALANGLSHARAVVAHATADRVLIFDRYLLDSSVRLRMLYGESRGFRWQNRLIRSLSPRPICSFLLDVAPEAALARKQDRWTSEGLAAHARLYHEAREAFGAVRIDGQAPMEEVCATIAETVWRHLTGRGSRWMP